MFREKVCSGFVTARLQTGICLLYCLIKQVIKHMLYVAIITSKDVKVNKGIASKRGAARAKALAPERRIEISKIAATARWNKDKPKATHRGTLQIGDVRITCAVLDNGMRVLSETGIADGFGSRTGGAKDAKKEALESGGAQLPVFLAAKSLKPFISNELEEGLTKPIAYVTGSSVAIGYPADLLPKICDVWLKAREAGELLERQKGIAQRAEILMRGLAHVGIIGLVDEATGFQEVRDRRALHAILDIYLSKEFAAWAKRFPDEFYRQIFRLRGWAWKGMKVNRPQIVAKYTTDIVYERLAPGIVDELEKRNPRDDSGERRVKHHQWLTSDIGHPALAQHLHGVIILMRSSSTWDDFINRLDLSVPKKEGAHDSGD